MLLLKESDRDTIVAFLSNATVPAIVGSNLIQIADLLNRLEELKPEEPKKDEN